MAKRLSQLEYTHALQRTRREKMTEPRAEEARFDCESRQIVVTLKNGATSAFPSELAQGLAGLARQPKKAPKNSAIR